MFTIHPMNELSIQEERNQDKMDRTMERI